MRKLLLVNLLLSVLLALPVVALQGDEKTLLRERLSRTVGAIADLVGIQERLAKHDPSAVAELLAASEAGPSDPAQAEVELVTVRTRVSVLQEILDARSAESEAADASRGTLEPTLALAPLPVAVEPPIAVRQIEVRPTSPDLAPASKLAFEAEGFVADRSRMGRACWRGARYLEGVAALEPLAGDPQADYWRARCLEKLARNAEAIKLYRTVIEAAGDRPEGRSAREDLEFLEWSIGHGLVPKS